MKNIRLILGSMTFGGALKEAQSHIMIKDWVQAGFCEIDTAIVYNEEETERILGRCDHVRDNTKLKVSTKVNPFRGFHCDEVIAQCNQSLSNLQLPNVDILYLHRPDHTIPIEETLKGVNELHKDGKFVEFGLSNYASWEVAEIHHICKEKGYVLPTVYQGMYNVLTRDVEHELLPVCRNFGIRFYAYNPLAGGLLSGKYNFSSENENQPGGRFFDTKQGTWQDKAVSTYQKRFWQDSYKIGAEHAQSAVKEVYGDKMTLLEASMCWLSNHSQLIDNDGIILGFSKPEHFQVNIDACKTLALDEKVVNAFDEAWNKIKSDCPKYNR